MKKLLSKLFITTCCLSTLASPVFAQGDEESTQFPQKMEGKETAVFNLETLIPLDTESFKSATWDIWNFESFLLHTLVRVGNDEFYSFKTYEDYNNPVYFVSAFLLNNEFYIRDTDLISVIGTDKVEKTINSLILDTNKTKFSGENPFKIETGLLGANFIKMRPVLESLGLTVVYDRIQNEIVVIEKMDNKKGENNEEIAK